jgi:CRP-like cAMP-binding protein
VPRTATVTTGTQIEALFISGSEFKRLLRDSPTLALKVLEELADRLEKTVLAGRA